jgi:hypothetical protein
MQPRQLTIIAIAAVVAFGAAFAVAGMGGDDPEVEAQVAAAPEAPQVIEVQDAKVSAGVASGKVSLPALKVPEPKPDPTPDSSSSSGTVAPPADTGTSDTGTVAPTTEVAPVAPQATPVPTPAPNNDPIKVGGGED